MEPVSHTASHRRGDYTINSRSGERAAAAAW